MNFNLNNYIKIIQEYKQKNYKFINFNNNVDEYKNIILRHDVDFDIQKAFEMAKAENSEDITSTFFFLLRSDSYNFSEKQNIAYIKKIMDLGHEIGIHFDSTLYNDPALGFELEMNLFKLLTGVDSKVISFHRPNNFYLDNNDLFFGLPHTYQNKFFKDIKYISDSGGAFFYDNPLKCDEFYESKSVQLLIHPIWWTTEGKTNIDKIKSYIESRNDFTSQHVAKNCKPWKQYLDKNMK